MNAAQRFAAATVLFIVACGLGAAQAAEQDEFFDELPISSAQADPDACIADFQRLCGDKVGRDERKACVRKHRKELSPECVKQREAKSKERRAACATDVQKFCKKAKGKALDKCMSSHALELSDSCKNAYPRTIARLERMARENAARIPAGSAKGAKKKK